ncbi:hypothetical protein A3D62_00370 [Candidatus Kaiserbacteria bacterium RIFCSPHIGHO2_02_FULL_49_11]|uniref:Excinuclease ABC subunit C n=1 Tax=Candidatus Kaiserbacteria bacterium RIFCSPHIGHO2_02_FULL_49_11 TaxID=1798489 RepID=A0A1F6D141_9BACT|nr:MAG: hypothetical protein A3D62_00370 [Candidatus Kaiserbacteria bacterium RIFCSPHIGHO2_02_FULL_49_11]
MKSLDLKKKKLPDSPGVYLFRGPKRKILYIGKATSLKDRVRSYFVRDIAEIRSPLIEKMIKDSKNIEYIETDSVLEALILEANLIKKHQPLYNTDEKDDKSFHYVVITKEKFPRVLTVRGKDLLSLKTKNLQLKTLHGPFPHGLQFKEAMKIIRKIFPYFDTKHPVEEMLTKGKGKHVRFNQSIGIYPGRQDEPLDEKEYRRTIRHLQLFLEGKKQSILTELKRDMKRHAKAQEFEKAAGLKRNIFALSHIRDVSLIKEEYRAPKATDRTFRIEAYDVAHISGKQTVGVMTVVEDGEVHKNEYRKFKISKDANNDVAALREILLRRLAHSEWPYPRLIVVDGGVAQVNAAKKVLEGLGYEIPVVGVVKDEHHRPRGFAGDKTHIPEREKEIILGNSEAHRFAISYHRARRGKLIDSK